MNRDVYPDCRESHPKIKSQNDFIKAIQDRKNMEEKKISMLTNKIIKEQKDSTLNVSLETFLKAKVGSALGLKNLG